MIFSKKNKAQPELPFSAYAGTEPYAFVSYAHADSDVVYPIIGELHDRGALIWYDEGIGAGTVWSQSIADRILNCSKFMLFLTPDAARSHHVRQEINFANSKNKPILPVYLKPTKLDSGIEMTLSVFQGVFHYAYKNDEESFYRQVLDALTDGFILEDAEDTMLDENFAHDFLLRLDTYGDKTLPMVIHLTGTGKFTVGRFDVSVGVQQSSFEFTKETKNISRRHAVFERTEDGYTVMDLESKAGTWVNGIKLPPNTPQQLNQGDQVSFGNAGANYIYEG